jgi:hypothetical protein
MSVLVGHVQLHGSGRPDVPVVGSLEWKDARTVRWYRPSGEVDVDFSGGCASVWFAAWPEDRRGILLSHNSTEVYRLHLLTDRAPERWFDVQHYEYDAGFRFTKLETVDEDDVIVITECGAARVADGAGVEWTRWHRRIDWQLKGRNGAGIAYETQDGMTASIRLSDGRLAIGGVASRRITE